MTGLINPVVTGFLTFYAKTSFNLVVTGFINPVVTRCQTNILNPVVMGFVNPVVTGCLIFMSKEHFF